VRPGPPEGLAACRAAPRRDLGAIGAGTGATAGTWRGPDDEVPGGLVGWSGSHGDLVVSALVAVNPWGDVVGHGLHGRAAPDLSEPVPGLAGEPGNTVIGVVATNARLDPAGCQHVARGAHDGLARAVDPPHSSRDGDAFVAAATGQIDAPVELVRWMAVTVVDRAIRSLSGGR
jgi:L-aminopeptidase/D-esterase-like protein